MAEFPLLSILIAIPLFGAILMAFIRGEEEDVEKNAKNLALFISGATFFLSLYLLFKFDGSTADFQFVENDNWLKSMRLSYYLGVDGISVFFILLSTFLTPVCILSAWNIKTRIKEYMALFLVLESLMIGTFCALDSFLFYVFFEGVLIPMFLIIGIWGGANKIYSSYKFFLYTLFGSVLMLLALLYLYGEAGTSSIPELMQHPINLNVQIVLWLAMFASFAVKMPMWPVHTWLPDAHVEAPTAGSVILAGVLLKMGGYGFLRLALPILPLASQYLMPLVLTLSVIGIIYTSLIALVQTDMKKLIAYSSVAHMGFVTLGVFSATTQGIEGAIFQMLSHGIISAALFLCIGVVYDRLHTRDINRFGGIVKNMPKYATLLMIFTLGSVGLPGTSGFVGEFLSLLGGFQVSTIATAGAALGLILGAAYMLRFYRKFIFGEATSIDAIEMPDLNKREAGILIVLAGLVLYLGVFPNVVLGKISPSVDNLMQHYHQGIYTKTSGEVEEGESENGL